MKDSEKQELLDRIKYPRKPKLPKITAERAKEILFELDCLSGWQTSPDNINAMGGKDQSARRAIVLAGELIGPLIEWAMNHITGASILRHDPAVPDSLVVPQADSAAVDRGLRANSHMNEWRGSIYNADNASANRIATSHFLGLLSTSMNYKPGVTVANGLAKLELGETIPEFAPLKVGRKAGSIELDIIKLQAVQHVMFHYGRGRKKTEVQVDISAALGVSKNTIESWEIKPDSRSSIDQAYFSKTLSDAYVVGLLNRLLVENDRAKLKTLRRKLPGSLAILDLADAEKVEKIKSQASKYSISELKRIASRYVALAKVPTARSDEYSV